MANPGVQGFLNKIWDEVLDHPAGALRTERGGTIGGEPVGLPLEPTTGALVVADYATVAAIEGDVVCRWANNITPGAVETVLTTAPAPPQPGIYYNLAAGDIVMVTQMCVELWTVSDSLAWELGYTTGVAGTGTFYPVTPKFIYKTGAAATGFDGVQIAITPPGPVRYSAGARSITFRVTANDAAAEITITWHGYVVNVGA